MNACNFEIGIKFTTFCLILKKTNHITIDQIATILLKALFYYLQNQITIPLKMFTFAIEICELLLLIAFIAGTSFCYKIHNKVRIVIQTLFQAIKSRTIKSKYQLLIERKYYQVFGIVLSHLTKLLSWTQSCLTKWL